MAEDKNALARAASAYLRSAMHQPVRWRQWGDDAFSVARRDDKPILLDIGAVWCHWCHVMDRESYENADVARLINENFIAVKVDRDERPDIDVRYQAAVQAISGQGGWPLTAFLTPDGRPFYGGTYFPPEDQHGRAGFKRVLQVIAQAYRDKHEDVLESAQSVMEVIGAESFAGRQGQINAEIVQHVIANAKSMFDTEHGGFGTAPKFPHPAVIDLLIDHYVRTGDKDARGVFVSTLDHMARGGVYDQLGGGFHRYSTDERWVVPHFEKMSYDNSELLKNYVHAFQATGIQFFGEVARDIIRWMDSWLSDREHGGFFASQDADISLEDDGDYFTWTLAEAREVLNGDELEIAALHYDINEIGEMHHNHLKNVLFQRASVEEIARRLGISPEQVAGLLRTAQHKLYEARVQRPTPYIDRTMYVGWNALCISAYLQADRALSLDDARHFALRTLDRLLAQGWTDAGELKHVLAYSDRQPPENEIAGGLDDYAFMVLACLDAYESTADLTYFNFARRIADALVERFYDYEAGGFFDREASSASEAQGALAARRKPFQDSPTPAGNSSAAIGLMRLYSYTNEARYRELAQRTLEVFAGVAGQFGIFAATYAIAVLSYSSPHTQVVVVGNDELAQRLYRAATGPFTLTKASLHLTDSEIVPQNLPPALRETIPNAPGAKDGRTVAIVCSGFTCLPPVDDAEALSRLLQDAISGRTPSDVSAAD
jgi:uncharacterized protein YyaL (SSP411 family)